jgi:uncharacterized membrane protein
MVDVPKGLALWLHIAAAAVLVGGALYARLAMQANAVTLAEDEAVRVNDTAAERFRGWVLAAIVVLLITGIYNYLHTGAHSVRYHVLLGIKLLLALHIFASALLALRPKNPRRGRQLVGAGISGVAAILIAVYLSQLA